MTIPTSLRAAAAWLDTHPDLADKIQSLAIGGYPEKRVRIQFRLADIGKAMAGVEGEGFDGNGYRYFRADMGEFDVTAIGPLDVRAKVERVTL